MNTINSFAIAILLTMTGTVAHGQFATVLNIPTDPDFPDRADVDEGSSIASNTQVNLFDGGSIGDNFSIGETNPEGTATITGSELNVYGGTVGDNLVGLVGNTINIFDGQIGSLYAGSPRVFNGEFNFGERSGSAVNISGGTFSNPAEPLGYRSVGVFDTQLSISDGNFLGNVLAVRSQVNIDGGTFNYGFSAGGGGLDSLEGKSSVAITGGVFRNFTSGFTGDVDITNATFEFDLYLDGSRDDSDSITIRDGSYEFVWFDLTHVEHVVIEGGNFNSRAEFTGGSHSFENRKVDISGGNFNDFSFGGYRELNISGGSFGNDTHVFGALVNITGGTFGNNFTVVTEEFDTLPAVVNLIGTEFFLDGIPIQSSIIAPEDYSDLTGTLATGAPFDFDTFFPNANFIGNSVLMVTVPEPSSISLLLGISAFASIYFHHRCGD